MVEAAGNDVTRFQPGDEVFGIAKGSYAEYARAREDKLTPKPANLTFEQAPWSPRPACPPCKAYATAGRCARGRRY